MVFAHQVTTESSNSKNHNANHFLVIADRRVVSRPFLVVFSFQRYKSYQMRAKLLIYRSVLSQSLHEESTAKDVTYRTVSVSWLANSFRASQSSACYPFYAAALISHKASSHLPSAAKDKPRSMQGVTCKQSERKGLN